MGQVIFEVPGPGQYAVTADPSLPALENPGNAAEILDGKQFYQADNTPVTGTMPNRGAVDETLEAGGSYTIPAGYHSGSGKVTADSLSGQTPGTADAGDIVQGETAWVNGRQITGTLVPGSITTDATATAGDILDGQTAYIATGKVTGTMPNNGAVNETLAAGGSYTVPAGYHNGEGSVAAQSLASQTPGTATAADIMQGETAWVNGAQVTGTATPGSVAADATATAGQILAPYTAYVASGKVTGTIPTNDDADVTINGAQVSVAAGYFAQAVSKAIPTVAQAVPSISVSDAGLITATATQNAGYVAQGTQSATQQLTVQGAQTITPGTAVQTIAAGRYLTGAQTIQGDANLTAGNIKDGVSIFGVQGTYSGEPVTFAVPLVVTVASGATVTAQNGDTTLTAVSNGTATIYLTAGGQWTVSAVLADGRATNTETVNITAQYTATLAPIPSAEYYGTTTNLSTPRYGSFGTLIAGYALFAGGSNFNISNASYIVDAYNTSLTRTIASDLLGSNAQGNATHNESYALVGTSSIVTAYNSTLTRAQPDDLNGGAHQSASAPVGQYALFVSSMANNNNGAATAYDGSLTKTTPDSDSTYRFNTAGGTVNSYALIAGGGVGISQTPDVITYDTSLTKGIAESLSFNASPPITTTIGSTAIFTNGTVINSYNETLSKTIVDSFPQSMSGSVATVCGQYAVFCRGSNQTMYALNGTLTRSTPPALPAVRNGISASSNNKYALFAGGRSTDNRTFFANVYVYTDNGD